MEKKERMKPSVFIKKYWRLLFGGFIIATIVFCSIFAPLLTNCDPELVDTAISKAPMSAEHILGTDNLGRDIWARLLFGSRNTLIIAVGAELLCTIVGAIFGLLCGYYKGVEKYLMRFLDAFSTIPNLLLCMMMVSIFGAGIPNLIVALSIGGIPGTARMVRNQVLSIKEKEYIESEIAMGASDIRIIFGHILPSCVSYLVVRFSNGLAGSVMSMTSLSFLGLGLDPTKASWGGIINEAQEYMFARPHVLISTTIAISLTVLGFSILGDGVRDLLDPKL